MSSTPNSVAHIPPTERVNSPTSTDSTDSADSVDHSVMYLNNTVQTRKLSWVKNVDERRGLGWSATIFGTVIPKRSDTEHILITIPRIVDGTKYDSSGYFQRKQEALNSAARNALIALGVNPETGK
ncbi:hypothetical protein FRB94_002944 [Tulasnella sp. JGI-2019a]|nr:hypothetical protein FRB93_013150 [Tulasnella sp. JGI-2019a]KAG9013416.1 hypothetical protein FRB94_002944 [Tulasnella sp. JGI-2019a]KAG9034745.1 hypothetical protein FRB95_012695 [Tulasnella sp. JGI-2019a]